MVKVQAGSFIQFKPGFHAKVNSRIHAKIKSCTECHDDPIDQLQVYSNSMELRERTVDFTVLSISKVDNSDTVKLGC